MKHFALLLGILFGTVPLLSQETTVFTEANAAYKRGMSFYEQGLFAKAQSEFKTATDMLLPVNEGDSKLLRAKSELYFAKCAIQLDHPDGEKLILDFIRTYSPDPIANQALIDVANYYFNAEDYDKAIDYFTKVPINAMGRDQRAEAKFKLGYAYFVKKQFANAKNNFVDVKDIPGDYFYPTNYYLGICYFFEGNYDNAIRSLRVAEQYDGYKPQIPYYIAQIYFAERRYDELIAYAEPKLADRKLQKDKEIRQLIGQSYFEKGEYAKALPYLEYYAERSSTMREEEFYQLAYAQYKTNNLQKAIKNFEELANADSQMAQFAMYYLADCYLKVGQKASARTAFGTAKRMSYDKGIQEEALFNYAKLSYELKDPREAIASLQDIGPSSRYYAEAQTLMSEIFLSYRDYKQALDILEKMQNKTPQLRESYQKVAYLRALQLIQENDLAAAKLYLTKSLQDPVDTKTKALAVYWQGDVAQREKDYDGSVRLITQFLTLAKSMTGLPDESSLFTANYIQGYNYLKQQNYTAALGFFQEAVTGIKRNLSFIASENVKNDVLGDATLRAGDCYFKRNQYADAVRYYDEAIDRHYSGFVYAIYQKAIIEGLRRNTAEKLLALERIVKDYPRSDFADDALLQLGITYQEIGQLNQAVPPLRQLVTDYKGKTPLVNQGLIRLGLITYNQNNPQGAISYYKQVFSNNPTPEEGSLALAALEEIYVDDLGRADEYFAFLETIPGYKVDNIAKDSISFKVAEAQFQNGSYQRAADLYSDYLRKYPNGRYILSAHYNRGESYAVLKQYDQALSDYEFVVERGQSTFYLKALEKAALIAYNYSQDFAKAYNFYTKLEVAATNEDMRFEAQLGALRSAYRTGNQQAVFDLSNKVANSSNASQDQKATANFYIGKIAFDRKDYDNALTSLNRVIAQSDNEQTAEARYLVAYIYYLKRDLEKAQQLCINANKESSAYPYWVAKSVLLLSDILAEKGDLYNARAALEALIENYTEDQEIVQTARTKLNQLNQQIDRASRLAPPTDPNRLEFDRDSTIIPGTIRKRNNN
ncbi:MAG: tetratricopeptide repeat protein [Saprospiraceae bacterium]|nr:tetratricopeptide repeat protein [Saprospiraceae bacterium]